MVVKGLVDRDAVGKRRVPATQANRDARRAIRIDTS
jgi:hypothetical protein